MIKNFTFVKITKPNKVTKNKKRLKRLKNKYRLTIFNEKTFAETFSMRLSLINTYTFIGVLALLLIVSGVLLVTYTPIKRILPNSEYKISQILYKNQLKIDSLESAIELQKKSYKRISMILMGADSLLLNSEDTTKIQIVSKGTGKGIRYEKSKEDALLRATVEAEDKFNVRRKTTKVTKISNLYLYPPIANGIVVGNYDASALSHFGVDIAAEKNAHVMATMAGTIISASWSISTGYSIVLQHDNDFISCYKHNAEILKKEGDRVEMGEVIAILGNTGEETSGPHLHFEIWHKGVPLNPQNYILF